MVASNHNSLPDTWVSVSSKVERQILAFAHLSDGWNYGRGKASSSKTIRNALWIRSKLSELGATTIEAFPKGDGGIVVSGLAKKDIVDVTCTVDGQYDIYIERDGLQILDSDNVSYATLVSHVRFLGWRAIPFSDFSIPSIFRGRKVGSTVQQFKNRKMAFQSSTNVAHSVAAARNVATSKYSTRTELVVHLRSSSG